MVLAVLTGWLDRQERQALAYLMEENRVLRRQLGRQRLQFTDADRRRLGTLGHRVGRRVLRQIATVVRPDTILLREEALRSPGCARRDPPLGVCGWRKRISP